MVKVEGVGKVGEQAGVNKAKDEVVISELLIHQPGLHGVSATQWS